MIGIFFDFYSQDIILKAAICQGFCCKFFGFSEWGALSATQGQWGGGDKQGQPAPHPVRCVAPPHTKAGVGKTTCRNRQSWRSFTGAVQYIPLLSLWGNLTNLRHFRQRQIGLSPRARQKRDIAAVILGTDIKACMRMGHGASWKNHSFCPMP